MRKVLELIVLSFVLLANGLSAANLVSVIVADSKDRDIGQDVLVDLNNMKEFARKISSNTGLTLKEVTLKGKDATAKNMLEKLKKLRVSDEDVVLFHFSGHGFRTESKGLSPWPNLYFSSQDQGVEYEKVAEILEEKKPRLLVIISDVCNSYIPVVDAPAMVRSFAPRTSLVGVIKKNYRRLFMEIDGVVKITSSRMGEYAWSTPDGGLFTNAFLESFERAAKSSIDADWYMILDRAAASIRNDQTPVYVIE